MEYNISIQPPGLATLNTLKSIDSNPANWGMWVALGRGDPNVLGVTTPSSTLSNIVAATPVCWAGYLDEDMYAFNHILHSESETYTILVRAKFPSSLSPNAYIREMALYIGGNCKLGTGDVLAVINHSRIWWDKNAQFQREIILTLPVPIATSMPGVVGTTSVISETPVSRTDSVDMLSLPDIDIDASLT